MINDVIPHEILGFQFDKIPSQIQIIMFNPGSSEVERVMKTQASCPSFFCSMARSPRPGYRIFDVTLHGILPRQYGRLFVLCREQHM